MTTWTVYRHLDRHGNVLYIGVTNDLTRRTRGHRNTAQWFDDVAAVEVVSEHGTRREALDAERAAIKAQRPTHNRAHNGRRRSNRIPLEPLRDRDGDGTPADPRVCWVLVRTGRVAHALGDEGRTVCGMNLDWRRVFSAGVGSDGPRCVLCDQRISERFALMESGRAS